MTNEQKTEMQALRERAQLLNEMNVQMVKGVLLVAEAINNSLEQEDTLSGLRGQILDLNGLLIKLAK